MGNNTLDKIRAAFYARMVEILLTALLAITISLCAYSLKAQAALTAKQQEIEHRSLKNEQRINALDDKIVASITSMQNTLDQRCDSLEEMLKMLHTYMED